MTTATANYSVDSNGRRLVNLNSKYTIQTNKTSAPATLDYKTDSGGNHVVSVGGTGVYESVEMLQVLNKI